MTTSGTDGDEEDLRHPLPQLPRPAQLPINRCNFPACILGGLTFQRYPAPLQLDGVESFHGRLFQEHLAGIETPRDRAQRFLDYMDVAFRLHQPEELGFEKEGPKKRVNATCFRLIRGWSADSNTREGAVLKGWVESRFGLLARYHAGPLGDTSSPAFANYMQQRAEGLFGTVALEAQLDLLFSYCQYEFGRKESAHFRLYRGIAEVPEADVIHRLDRRRCYMLLNNLSSFTSERERAEEFGYWVMEVQVPASKVFFHNRLIPRLLTGEDEFMVIGGLYEVSLTRF